jgi:integrase
LNFITVSTLLCPRCGHDKSWKNGHCNGSQRWLCTNCGREYIESQNASDHVQRIQKRVINGSSSNLKLVSEAEKHEETRVCGGSCTERRDMQTRQIHEKSDLLKDFPKDIRAKILEFAVKRENQGYKATRKVVSALRTLLRHGVDLLDPESVKVVLKELKVSETTKWVYSVHYETFLKFLGGTWERPVYKQQQRIPFLPTEAEIDQLIAGFGYVLATFCQIAKETAARKGEIEQLRWTDIDFERRLITINAPEKRSRPRIIPVTEKCIKMITALPKKGNRIFSSSSSIRSNFYKQRKKLAYKLDNPRLLKITLHTFRHWKATMEYHKNPDPFYLRDFLGHKNLKNTEIYVHLERMIYKQTTSDEFIVKVATSLEDFTKLLEVGFSYIGDYGQNKVLRKRK